MILPSLGGERLVGRYQCDQGMPTTKKELTETVFAIIVFRDMIGEG